MRIAINIHAVNDGEEIPFIGVEYAETILNSDDPHETFLRVAERLVAKMNEATERVSGQITLMNEQFSEAARRGPPS